MSSRKYRSASEWQALIEEQMASGLTGVAFCNERGLSAKSFYKQRKRLGYPRGQARSSSSERFIQVQPAVSPSASRSVVLHYRDCHLELSASMDASWVAELLRALA